MTSWTTGVSVQPSARPQTSTDRSLGESRKPIAFTDAVYAHVATEPDYTAAIERARRARGL